MRKQRRTPDKVAIYTTEQFQAKLRARAKVGPNVRYVRAGTFRITDVKRVEIDGIPCLVIYHAASDGEKFGVIMDKQYADELRAHLGPHPLVDEFFKVH